VNGSLELTDRMAKSCNLPVRRPEFSQAFYSFAGFIVAFAKMGKYTVSVSGMYQEKNHISL